MSSPPAVSLFARILWGCYAGALIHVSLSSLVSVAIGFGISIATFILAYFINRHFVVRLDSARSQRSGVERGLMTVLFWPSTFPLSQLLVLLIVSREHLSLLLLSMIGTGACIGWLTRVLAQFEKSQIKRWTLGALVILTCLLISFNIDIPDHQSFGLFLLVLIPVFFLITLIYQEDVHDLPIIVCCGLLCLSLLELTHSYRVMRATTILLPFMLYIWYSRNARDSILFLRDYTFAHLFLIRDRPGDALLCLQRAQEREVASEQLQDLYWEVLSRLTPEQVPTVLDSDGILARVAEIPDVAQGHRLLDLLSSSVTESEGWCRYWRAKLFLREKRSESAIEELQPLLDDTTDDELVAWCWNLLLQEGDPNLHSFGQSSLLSTKRRLHAIRCVDRYLTVQSDDRFRSLKELLYLGINDRDLDLLATLSQPRLDFKELSKVGLELIQQNAHWKRGCRILNLAADGLADSAPTLYLVIAHQYQHHHDSEQECHFYQKCRERGEQLLDEGVLNDQAREDLFRVAQMFGQQAEQQKDWSSAFDHYFCCARTGFATINEYRALADLSAKRAEEESLIYALDAVRWIESALSLKPDDGELRCRRDAYYYSVRLEDLQAQSTYQQFVNLDYCREMIEHVLSRSGPNVDNLQWAEHLAAMACMVDPSPTHKLLRARVCYALADHGAGELHECERMLLELRDESHDEVGYHTLNLLGKVQRRLEKIGDAIATYLECSKHEKSGIEARRTLADLYEIQAQQGSSLAMLNALRWMEAGLVLNPEDDNLRRRRDAYYYSIDRTVLQSQLAEYRSCINVEYCQSKAQELLTLEDSTPENLNWAMHLIQTALLVETNDREICKLQVTKADIHLAKQEVQQAKDSLQHVVQSDSMKTVFGGHVTEWFGACKKLGELYLDSLDRPEDAIEPLMSFYRGPTSGARTCVKLGIAYQRLGNLSEAKRWYREAAAYSEDNPWSRKAQDALTSLEEKRSRSESGNDTVE